MSKSDKLTYRDAGVDIDAGNRLVEDIKGIVGATHRPEVLGGIGGFGGLFELPLDRYRRPVLVSGTDGVGTKLKLAIQSGRYRGIGIDLVAMCVNDVLTLGAEPLFFLDYYATSKLDNAVAGEVIRGIAEGCRQAGAALIGGETAEMPGMYSNGDFDLAGFCVGIVEHDRIIDGSQIQAGDRLIALASSGPHSNGYSLIRKILDQSGADMETAFAGATLADALLAPTRIYVESVRALLKDTPVHGMAHITGGGLAENLARVLPADCAAQIQPWPWPDIFGWLQETGGIEDLEMRRTFNCGVGMILALAPEAADPALTLLRQRGESAWLAGEIVPRGDGLAVHLVA